MGDTQGARARNKKAGMQKGDYGCTKEHCDKMIELMSNGKTVAQVCVALDICKTTFFQWKIHVPDFLAAYNRGLTLCEAYHDEEVERGKYDPDFNLQAHKYLTTKLFGAGNRKIHKSIYNLKDVKKTLDNYLKQVDTDEVDLVELEQLIKSMNNVAALKNNTEIAEKLAELEKIVKAREAE